MNRIKKIGVLTGGSDSPGLNAVIRAITRTAIIKYGLMVMGIKNGYYGLYHGDMFELTLENTSGILEKGGTILHTSDKTNLFKYPVEEEGEMKYIDVSDSALANLDYAEIDALVIIGGAGTLTSARDFARKGLKIVGVPKTIDNDLTSTDVTFGFDTAVAVATEALDRLKTTARSHHRVICLEVMGRYAGWIALYAGIGGGADVILIPEIPYEINKVAEAVEARLKPVTNYSLIIVAEGARPRGEEMVVREYVDSPSRVRLGGIGSKVARELGEIIGLETRATTLGHLQRGGTPTAFDRLLSTRYGKAAVDQLLEGNYGVMVTLTGNQVSAESLETVIGKTKRVDPTGEIVQTARNIGISFGS